MLLIFNFFLQSFISGWTAKSSWYMVLWIGRSAVRIPGETGKTSLIRVDVGPEAFVINELWRFSPLFCYFFNYQF